MQRLELVKNNNNKKVEVNETLNVLNNDELVINNEPPKLEFPQESEFVNQFVKWASSTTDAPLQFLLGGALISMSAAMGRKVLLNNRIYPNLWLALIGESSISRKSTSIYLAKMLCEKAGIATFPDRLTPESFYETLSLYPQGLFALSELGGWLGSFNRNYAIGFKQDMAELYDCPSEFTRIRKGAKGKVIRFKITNPYICIIGASTLEWFEQNIQNDDSGGGFLPRFQFILGTPRPPYPVPPNLNVPHELVSRLQKLASTQGNIILDEKSGLAYNFYEEWFYNFRLKLKNMPSELAPYGARLETAALKMAVIFEADKNPGGVLEKLSPDSVEIGCQYAECFLENARIVIEKLSFSNFERLCRRILGVIEKNPGATQRDILRVVCVPRSAFADAINYLEEAGRVKTVQAKPVGRGRPTIRYFPV